MHNQTLFIASLIYLLSIWVVHCLPVHVIFFLYKQSIYERKTSNGKKLRTCEKH